MRLIPVRRARGDIHNVAAPDVAGLGTDTDRRSSRQDVLLMFDRVGVRRHPAAWRDDKPPHGEMRAFIGPDEHLAGRACSDRDGLGADVVHAFDGHVLLVVKEVLPDGKIGTLATGVHEDRMRAPNSPCGRAFAIFPVVRRIGAAYHTTQRRDTACSF